MTSIGGKGLGDRERSGLLLMRKPVQSAQVLSNSALREGSTGRVVYVGPSEVRLQKVWAVAAAGTAADEAEAGSTPVAKPQAELAFYRKYTEALLRRYLRLSLQAGRIPSLMSREVFRGQVTHYKVRGFEEVVIFCHDVEQRLARLTPMDQRLIKRMGLQQYSREEAAVMLGISRTACKRRYHEAVDRLTGMLLEVGLLDLSRR